MQLKKRPVATDMENKLNMFPARMPILSSARLPRCTELCAMPWKASFSRLVMTRFAPYAYLMHFVVMQSIRSEETGQLRKIFPDLSVMRREKDKHIVNR